MAIEKFTIKTKGRTDLVDVTGEVRSVVDGSGVREGLCFVYVPHTTAGVTINENADPSVRADIIGVLDRLVPWEGGYAHAEGNSAAHVKASMMGSCASIPVEKGRLVLGTWQGVYFCDFDGPRSRTCIVKVVEG